MRQRKQGMTLVEKITSHQDKVAKRNVVKLITDAFFEHYEEQGSLFQLRRTNLQRDDGRTLNIVDEIEVEEQQEREVQIEEEKKDIPFNVFKDSMAGHIEGTAANDREAQDSQGEEAEDGKKSVKVSVSKKGSVMNRTGSAFDGDRSIDNINDAKSKRSSKRSTLDKSQYQNMSLNKMADSFKFVIPESCHISMMKKVLIEKMEAKYFLASHPFPKLEGEMIICKPKKNDQTQGKEVIIYRDYSLRKRIETTPQTANSTTQAMQTGKKKVALTTAEKKAEEEEK